MLFWWFLFFCDLLIPVSMIFAGHWMEKHCAKRMSRFSGYRTARSMKNTQTWRFANKFCGRLWKKTGGVLTLLSVFVQLFFLKGTERELGIFSCILVFVQTVCMLLTILPVEKALKKEFDEYGGKRS